MSDRYNALCDWLETILPETAASLLPASSDASFRRYFRVHHNGTSYIVMDAPPPEDCAPFIAIAAALADLGLHVPKVLAGAPDQGFLLLTDLGPCTYLDVLNEHNVAGLYDDALQALARLQRNGDPASPLLPVYDAALLTRELALFPEWFLTAYRGYTLNPEEQNVWDDACRLLVASALEQPRVWVHRDYHSRNLMATVPNPGVLDFQGAVIGPVTYDLVSLLKDCYITWPRDQVVTWALAYRAQLQQAGFAGLADAAQFLRWFDLMGAQRHLKAIGIFARLHLRDGKPNYLPDIPRTLAYVHDVCTRYPALAALGGLLARVTA